MPVPGPERVEVLAGIDRIERPDQFPDGLIGYGHGALFTDNVPEPFLQGIAEQALFVGNSLLGGCMRGDKTNEHQ